MKGTQSGQSVTGKAIQFVVRDVLLDVARFPVWWYTTGTFQALRFVLQELLTVVDRLSLRILVRNLFKPMYGDYSKSGRSISLVMRLVVFAFRVVGLFLWTLALLLIFLVWITLPIVTVYQIIVHLLPAP